MAGFFGKAAVFNVPVPKNKKSFLAVLEEKISDTIAKNKVAGIGVGLPGITDIKNGVLVKSLHLPFLNNWNAKKFFKKFGLPAKFDNDSRCFLIAETNLGAGKAYKNIAAMTIGTGIGGGLMIDGKIYYGRGGAGEFGHVIIDDKKTLEDLGAKDAFRKMGNRSHIIGVGIANIINSFDPDMVILGGGGVFRGGVDMKKVKEVARKNIMSPISKKTKIVKGKLGENAQAIGAALLFKKK